MQPSHPNTYFKSRVSLEPGQVRERVLPYIIFFMHILVSCFFTILSLIAITYNIVARGFGWQVGTWGIIWEVQGSFRVRTL